MPKGANQRLKMLYLAKIMLDETDEDHYLDMRQIIDKLGQCGVSADRKSLYNDLADLSDFGIDVEGVKEGRSYYYHVVGRQFELAELKLLVDLIQSSRFMTAKKSHELIGKLESLVSYHEASQLQRQVYVSGRVKTINEGIYYNVDVIHNAIAMNKQISFQYFQWNVDKEMELRHKGAFYQISPWGLSWDNENYYMIGFEEVSGKIKHYRVDKMVKISLSDKERAGKETFEKLDMAAYTNTSFGMFGGREEVVRLKVKNYLSGVIIDRFGKDIQMHSVDAEHFVCVVRVQVSPQFIGWLFALGDGIKVMSPESVVDEVKCFLNKISGQYEDEV